MPFLSPYFLVGLAGAAVPVVIHLLIRDHLRRVEFSTLRFFVKTSRLALRRKRLREMLLVALRAAVCALLAVAFARPFIRGEEIGDDPGKLHARTARVIVADVSGSMARGGAAEALRAEARKAVESLSAGADAVAVVSFDQAARVEAPLSRQFALAARAVEALTPGQGGTNIPQALRVADAELSQAYATTREIVLISDLQRSGWRELREDFLAKKLSPGTRLVVRPIRPGGDGHVAIAGGSAPDTAVLDREPISVSVRIANYSDPGAPGEGVAVRLKLGDEAQTRKVNLRAGGMAAATFRPVLTTPGDHPGTITVATGQGSADDVFYFNTRVIPKIKVLVLDGPGAPGSRAGGVRGAAGAEAGAGGQGGSDAAAFVETAMVPAPDVASPFEYKTLAPSQAAAGDVGDARVVVLVDVHQVAKSVREALAGLLARGGGLLFLPGPGVEANAFAECFGDLAPCKLRRIRTAPALAAGRTGAHLTKIDFQHPIFEVFLPKDSHPRNGDLSLPRFDRYWEVTDSQLSRVLAKFDDNRPAVVSRQIGRGTSMLLAAAPDPAWTDFAKQTTFLPYVWQTLKYLSSRTELRTHYTVGDPLPAPKDGELKGPGGKAVEKGESHAAVAGFYTLRDAQGKTLATLAVNRSPDESDPQTVPSEEIVAAMERPGAAQAAAHGGSGDAKGKDTDADDQALWRWVLLAVAVVLAGELLLGNKTLRH